MVKTENGDSWETHKSNVTDMMIKPNAINIKNCDMHVFLILKQAATIMMVLRLKQIAAKNDFNFQFTPLQVQYWTLRKKKNFNEMTAEEALDAIIYGIFTETSDSWDTTPRTTNKVRSADEDDEDRCERLIELYFNKVYQDKAARKRFTKKIGKLHNAIIQFITRNEMVIQNYIWVRQQAPAFTNDTPIEKKEEIMNKKTFPNFRIATFTIVGRYEKEDDEKHMTRALAKTLRKLHQTYLNAFKVSYINNNLLKTDTPNSIKSIRTTNSQKTQQK